MLVQTTTRTGKALKKPFSWSYTKLKNYEACPKRHYHIDIAKDYKEEEGEALAYGNTVHKVLEQRIAHGTILPPVLAPDLEPWAQWVEKGEGTIKVEQQLAITKDFQPCEWFGKDAWYRAKVDVMKLNGPVGICIDWKTGKVLEDYVQLSLTAACMFYHYPELQVVRSVYVWVKDDAKTVLTMKRDDLPAFWNSIWSRLEALRDAYANTDFPPTPNRLCRSWCPVTSCPHNGRG